MSAPRRAALGLAILTALALGVRPVGGTPIQVRVVGALLAVLVVPPTCLLARRVARRGWSLWAAAIPAASLLHLLAGRFSPEPDPDDSDQPLADEHEEVADWPGFFGRLLSAIASGPVVEVYRVP